MFSLKSRTLSFRISTFPDGLLFVLMMSTRLMYCNISLSDMYITANNYLGFSVFFVVFFGGMSGVLP